MARYAETLKNRVVAKLLPPESASVSAIAKEVGVTVQTLERWRDEAQSRSTRGRTWTAGARRLPLPMFLLNRQIDLHRPTVLERHPLQQQFDLICSAYSAPAFSASSISIYIGTTTFDLAHSLTPSACFCANFNLSRVRSISCLAISKPLFPE